ncbi:MAG: glycosyltransferase family 4 protein, partial [Alphaproteobacteria bacterium]
MERVVENLAAGQVRAGWKVTVLTKAVADAPPSETRPDGVRVIRYPHAQRFTPWVYLTSWWHSRRLAQALALADAPDIVHYHLTLSAQGPLSALNRQVPGVYTFYGPWHAEFAVEAEPLRAKRSAFYPQYLDAQIQWQRRMQAKLLDKANKIIILSEFSRRRVAELAPHRAPGAIVIPGGVDPQRFKPQKANQKLRKELDVPAGAFVVLTVRRLVRRMGLNLLLDAVAQTQKQGVDIHCLVGGVGPLHGELQQQAQRLGI